MSTQDPTHTLETAYNMAWGISGGVLAMSLQTESLAMARVLVYAAASAFIGYVVKSGLDYLKKKLSE